MVPGRWDGPAGAGVVARLRAAGVLSPGLVAAHCVGLRPGDAEALAAAEVGVAHCPRSNRHLLCGRAPVEAMGAAGVRLGLGTDSPSSGGDYDLRREARAAQGEHAGVVDLGPADLLRLATLGGARALGMERLVGTLEEGKRADLIALRPEGPADDPALAAMLPRSAVTLVVVDGEPLLRDGEPLRIDPAEVATRADEARSRLC
jgi:5-methylthioadenosine/S-adenosylhomocysteine deaminase